MTIAASAKAMDSNAWDEDFEGGTMPIGWEATNFSVGTKSFTTNPNATYVLDKYPTQNAQTSNTLYERTRKYGYGYENEDRGREAYTDALGNTRHRPNIKPYNYVLPIPIQIIQSNKDKKIEQNAGY